MGWRRLRRGTHGRRAHPAPAQDTGTVRQGCVGADRAQRGLSLLGQRLNRDGRVHDAGTSRIHGRAVAPAMSARLNRAWHSTAWQLGLLGLAALVLGGITGAW